MPVASNSRTRLVRSALDLFGQRGVANVTLEDVVAKVGVTKGSLYWHFASKQELVLAAADLYYELWMKKAGEAINAAADPIERIRAVWDASLDMCLFNRSRRRFSTEIYALGLDDADIRASWTGFYDRVRDLYRGLIDDAAAAGHIEVADSQRLATWILDTFEGIKYRASLEPQPTSPAEKRRILDGLMQMLFTLETPAKPQPGEPAPQPR